MTAIKLLAETERTVTLKRQDFEALLRAAENAADLAAVQAHQAYEDRVGWETARRNYLTVDEARRLLDGESPVRVWREKRGIRQRALAEAAEVAVSYLAEIEGGKKPGSAGALQRIARILDVPLDGLIGSTAVSEGLRPVNRSNVAVERLVKFAEAGMTREQLQAETRAIIDEWTAIGERDRVKHQVRAAIGGLQSKLAELSQIWASREIDLQRKGEKAAARRLNHAALGLEAAIDVLDEVYSKRSG
jgi:transcriptional regulator with XRE-family HTH domain